MKPHNACKRSSASFKALMQDPAIIVFDNRQLHTFPLCQSMIATK
ncbi:hypothetical protein METH_17585 [Leisingera methylohalidivorans DSM 14336]|uniref:Uncharacterized protein n=1 Tax=Leisingera methylohalidivorans DSM 14336 TaxID=999552 RepID=V9W0U3_9RHOB|nr:hypothetical protein METH_17585 [Leisingera methylohalidivorans DSM 14336]